jgi:F0F1-type ATP synthase assembly protein I
MSRPPGPTDSSVPQGTRSPRPEETGSAGSDMAKGFSQASYGLSVAFAFVGVVIAFWFAGRALDGWLGVEPWFQVIGAVVGWGVGIVVVYYAAQRGES